jgi:hypothetical protein
MNITMQQRGGERSEDAWPRKVIGGIKRREFRCKRQIARFKMDEVPGGPGSKMSAARHTRYGTCTQRDQRFSALESQLRRVLALATIKKE